MSSRSKISQWLEDQQGKIKKWASRISHKLNPEDLDDLAQQVSLELLSQEDEIDEPEALARTVTTYRVYDLLNRRAAAPQSLEDWDGSEHSQYSERAATTLRRPNSAREQCLDLWNAVGQLPGAYRAILIERWIEGNTFSAIAAARGLPESTVRHYYGEAVEQLGKILKYVSLSGVVTDDETQVLDAAQVTARSVTFPEYRKTLTDRHGQFCFIFLHKSRYSLLTRKAGYSSDQRYLELTRDLHVPAIVLSRSNKEVALMENKRTQ